MSNVRKIKVDWSELSSSLPVTTTVEEGRVLVTK